MQIFSQRTNRNAVHHLLSQLENKQKMTLMKSSRAVNKNHDLNLNIKLKSAWKGSGYSNCQFDKIKLISYQSLNPWAIQRMQLAERSYKPPKNFKGFKTGIHFHQFSSPPYELNIKSKQRARGQSEKKDPNQFLVQKKSDSFGSKSQSSLKFHRAKDTLFGFKSYSFKNSSGLSKKSEVKT